MKTPKCLAGLLVVASLACCRSTPVEEDLRLWIEEAVGEAERGDVGGLLDRLSEDFRLTHGGTGKRELRQRLLYVVSRTRGAKIYFPRPEIDMSVGDAQAEVRFPFLLSRAIAAGPSGGAEPTRWIEELADKTRLMRITLWLREENGRWRAHQARVEKFTGLEFKPLREY